MIPLYFGLLQRPTELLYTVETYAASLNKDEFITTVNDILLRAQACIESGGGAFENKLKFFKKT